MSDQEHAHVWIVFIRGINVGGRNKVLMADLRRELAADGAERAATYIQSGNVVLSSADLITAADACAIVAGAVERAAAIRVTPVACTLPELRSMVARHPDRDTDIPPKWLLIGLLDRPADVARSFDADRVLPDRIVVDTDVVFLTYPNGVGRSKLTLDVVERATGAVGTARNLSTLAAVIQLAESFVDAPKESEM